MKLEAVAMHVSKLQEAADLIVVRQRSVAEPQKKPRYTLDELLAKCDYSQPMPPEDREWIDAPSVGREL